MEAPLNLAEIGVRDIGALGKLSERHLGQLALGFDKFS